MLLVLGPIAVIVFLLRLARKRAIELGPDLGGDDDGADDHDGDDDEGRDEPN